MFVLIIFILCYCYRRKARSSDQAVKQMYQKMERLEVETAKACKEGMNAYKLCLSNVALGMTILLMCIGFIAMSKIKNIVYIMTLNVIRKEGNDHIILFNF